MITCLGCGLFVCICCARNVVKVVNCYRMCKQSEMIVTGVGREVLRYFCIRVLFWNISPMFFQRIRKEDFNYEPN